MYIAFVNIADVCICLCADSYGKVFVYSGVCTAIMMIGELSFRDGSRQRKTFIPFILYFSIVIITILNH